VRPRTEAAGLRAERDVLRLALLAIADRAWSITAKRLARRALSEGREARIEARMVQREAELQTFNVAGPRRDLAQP
jgi:hypothetical protein